MPRTPLLTYRSALHAGLFATLLLASLFATLPVRAAAASSVNPATPVVLTPEQARAALKVLDDPVQRGHIEDTLRAVAAAGALATPQPAASTPTAASAAAASGASSASGASASTALSEAFRSNGLVLQMSTHVVHVGHMLGGRLASSRDALFDLTSVRAWWNDKLGSTQGRALMVEALRVLLVTLIPALVIEYLLRKFIARPRKQLVAQAAPASRDAQPVPGSEAQAADAPPAPTTSMLSGAQAHVEAFTSSAMRAASAAMRQTAGLVPRGVVHWHRLQRLPSALFVALLDVVPILGFGLSAAATLSFVTDEGEPVATAIGDLVDTYVLSRVVLLVCTLIFAPRASGLRLLPLSDTWAVFAQRWATRLVVVGALGGVIGAAVPLGMTEDAHLALIKVVALATHILLCIAILQCRRPVGDALRRADARHGPLAWLAHWLADVWAWVVVFAVMALWLIWAMDVHDGYRSLLRSGALSLIVLLAARVIAIVVLGAIARGFDPQGEREAMSVARRRVYRYYPIVRAVVTVAIALITFDVLLHVWGVSFARLFVNASIGHLLGSALVTIAIAVVIAIAIWEAVNVAAEQRLDAWTLAGDYVRAARLRTLLPMLRTSLLVAILIVVGLTALSQLGINTGPLVAGASIFGVALGFGSQKLVQDFITGIFLLTENAMQVGDSVTVAGVSGTVEFLSIRTVRLRGGDGSLYTVPFSSVTTVNNSNRGIGNAAVKVALAFGADVPLAIETLKEIGRDLRADDAFKDGILSDFSFWGIDQVDGASITLVGQIQCKDTTRWSVQREFNRLVLVRFTERGIPLANPQRSVLVEPPPTRTSDETAGKHDDDGPRMNA